MICENEEVFFQIDKDGTENIIWSLSDGRKFEGLSQNILFEEAAEIRDQINRAVSPEEMQVMLTALEKIATIFKPDC